jgi:hypothetical protein
MIVIAGTFACSKAEEEVPEKGAKIEEGKVPFEGTIKVVYGKYVYVPEVQGFDIIIHGTLESGDISSLEGKEVKGEAHIDSERTSVLIADTIEVKEENGTYRNVFTRTEEVVLEDYIDLHGRSEFTALKDISYDKKNVWEEKEKAKVYGKLEEEDGNFKIVVIDEEDGKQVGKIIVDNFTDISQYYLKKLDLFDSYWFYVNIKDTVAWATRRRTRELFHADVVFTGLF